MLTKNLLIGASSEKKYPMVLLNNKHDKITKMLYAIMPGIIESFKKLKPKTETKTSFETNTATNPKNNYDA